jgi:hypothetical protein
MILHNNDLKSSKSYQSNSAEKDKRNICYIILLKNEVGKNRSLLRSLDPQKLLIKNQNQIFAVSDTMKKGLTHIEECTKCKQISHTASELVHVVDHLNFSSKLCSRNRNISIASIFSQVPFRNTVPSSENHITHHSNEGSLDVDIFCNLFHGFSRNVPLCEGTKLNQSIRRMLGFLEILHSKHNSSQNFYFRLSKALKKHFSDYKEYLLYAATRNLEVFIKDLEKKLISYKKKSHPATGEGKRMLLPIQCNLVKQSIEQIIWNIQAGNLKAAKDLLPPDLKVQFSDIFNDNRESPSSFSIIERMSILLDRIKYSQAVSSSLKIFAWQYDIHRSFSLCCRLDIKNNLNRFANQDNFLTAVLVCKDFYYIDYIDSCRNIRSNILESNYIRNSPFVTRKNDHTAFSLFKVCMKNLIELIKSNSYPEDKILEPFLRFLKKEKLEITESQNIRKKELLKSVGKPNKLFGIQEVQEIKVEVERFWQSEAYFLDTIWFLTYPYHRGIDFFWNMKKNNFREESTNCLVNFYLPNNQGNRKYIIKDYHLMSKEIKPMIDKNTLISEITNEIEMESESISSKKENSFRKGREDATSSIKPTSRTFEKDINTSN